MSDETTGLPGYNTGLDMMGTAETARQQAQSEGEVWLRCECGNEWRTVWGSSCSRCAEARQQPLAPVAIIRALSQSVPSNQDQSDQNLAKDILDGIEADAQLSKELWMVAGYTPELKTVEDRLAQTVPARLPADPQATNQRSPLWQTVWAGTQPAAPKVDPLRLPIGWAATADGTLVAACTSEFRFLPDKPKDTVHLPATDQQLSDYACRVAASMGETMERWKQNHRLVMASIPADAPTEDKASDHVGPDDAAHRSAKDTIDHLVNGRITAPARKAIGDALDTANRAPPPNPTGATKPSPWHNGRRGVSVGDGILR